MDIINETAGGRIRLILDANGSDTVDEQFIVENSGITCRRILKAGQGLNTNSINTNTDVDLTISRNGNEFLRLDKANDNITCSKEIVAGGGIKNNTFDSDGTSNVIFKRNDISKLELYNDRTNINNEFRVTKTSDSNNFRIQLSNHLDCYEGTGGGNTMLLNYYSKGNVFLGSDQATKPTVTVNRFAIVDSPYAFEVGGDSGIFWTVSTNTLNSESGDLTIQRDGIDVINIFTYSPTNGPSIIVDAQSDCGISSSWLFANTFANRTGDTDTEFRGAISGGLNSGKVYMTYKHVTETLDFDCVIDNTGGNVIGNLISTGVSDKRLKTNIQDIDDANYSDCVKNVKLKTFEFKDKKFENQDNYGMIAQDLQEHLPKEFTSIVRQNIPKKDEDKEYLSINYMKLSVVLWGCCQEQQSKIEHLEASIYEMMEDIKELKGKKTTKPKAKAKSKTKVEK